MRSISAQTPNEKRLLNPSYPQVIRQLTRLRIRSLINVFVHPKEKKAVPTPIQSCFRFTAERMLSVPDQS